MPSGDLNTTVSLLIDNILNPSFLSPSLRSSPVLRIIVLSLSDIAIPFILVGTGVATVIINWEYIEDKVSDALDITISWATNKDSRTASDIIAKEKKGSINREFPSEWIDKTYGEIKDAAKKGDKSARQAKKLLDSKKYDKRN